MYLKLSHLIVFLTDHRGDHRPSDGDAEKVETDNRNHNSLSPGNELHPVIEGNHVLGEQAKHITSVQVVQSDNTLPYQEIPKKRHHRRSRRQHEKDVTNLPDTIEDHVPDCHEKKRKHSKSHHHHEETDANDLSDNAMEKGQEMHKKKRKHRKSHVDAETDDTNLSDTALVHSLLDILEDDNRRRKERRKKKKRKRNQDNCIEKSEGVNVS
ncbi:hypothetical protein CHS0354_027303 [Potamilus streckersoni]|uniref:Uncharacterized protein n=1 Tax=Potamilus streckersoni TaxID=2493646 RepID=A0AAE0TEJ9_9BIVA|nr:hypothetical protein CHS0354_027303 [Potamilus streckersoni]